MATVIRRIVPNADTVIILKVPVVQSAVSRDSVIDGLNSEEPASSEGSSSQKEIHYRVSSIHLRVASPYFERMFSGNWKESTLNEKDGRYHTAIEDQDPDALLILLNVLHLRNRQVPRSVSLDMLAKIALLVDYFNCVEAVELSVEMWVKDLKIVTPIPSEPCWDFILWMFIAWVFKLPKEFTHITSIAVKLSKPGDFFIEDLPIGHIVDRIDRTRSKAISTVASKLNELLKLYRSTSYLCPKSYEHAFECGAILCGALAKGMDSIGLLEPCLETTIATKSFQEIYSKAYNMKSPRWRNMNEGSYSQHSCDMIEHVRPILDGVMKGIKDLELKDFARYTPRYSPTASDDP